jgi:phosphatidylserine/phosphatidylglycerophosphate/cardiolipin synthase-like enzyme
MFLKVDANGSILQRREIAGWSKAVTSHAANLAYIDATMIYDGSILAITTANPTNELHLLATPSGPAMDMHHGLPSPPHAVTTLLDGSIVVLTTAGTLHRADFASGPWLAVPAPGGPLADITVSPDGHLICLTAAGVVQQAPAPGVPGMGAVWAALGAVPALPNIQRIEYLRNGSLIGIDNGNVAYLSPRNPAGVLGAWQQLQNFGAVLAVTPLGGHTLLGIDPADHRLMTADALPENWAAVAGPAAVQVLALAHLPAGTIAALCSDQLIYQAPFSPPAMVGGPWVFGAWAQLVATPPPVPAIGMTANRGGRIFVVGNDHQLYTWDAPNRFQPVGQWSLVPTGAVQLSSVAFLDDGLTLYGIGQIQNERYVCRPTPVQRIGDPAAWRQLANSPVAISCATRAKDGSILEVEAAAGALRRRPGVQAAQSSCGWAGQCRQVIELSSDPADTRLRATKWLLQYSFPDPAVVFSDGNPYGDGRPWGDGTAMAARAQHPDNYYPWDAGSRVTPLIGGFAALSAMRDAFEAAIAEAHASAQLPGQRGYVYIADWLLTPLRDLSEDNPWGGAAWGPAAVATHDQTAIGLIARMMSVGIKVRILVWMPTSTQAVKVGQHARQHWQLARMVQELNTTLKNQGGNWANVDCGVVALDLRTAPVTAVSLHQKMCVVRVGAVNIGFCGGADLAYTRRDFRRPASSITGLGDWQSGVAMPTVSGDWPKSVAPPPVSPVSGYPQLLPAVNDDVIPDELGTNVYGVSRRWHDQHLKLEGPAVTALEAQFDERWRVPGRPYLFDPNANYGLDNQVQFTSASAFAGTVIQPLTVTPCEPAGSALVQLWRTIPVDKRRTDRAPFGRGEFTVMAGIAKAVQQASQLITIWDQYFWSEPLSRLLAARVNGTPDLKVLIVLPPFGSNDPPTELWYRRRALQTLWAQIKPAQRNRVMVLNLWSAPHNVGVYVHAKVQTYDDGLLVCGSANMNRRSFTLDMELDLAVAHKPDVWYHLANLAHMLTGQPWLDSDHGWLQRYWTFITTHVNLAQATVTDPFFCDPGQIRQATPNAIPYAPNAGLTPETVIEPTSVNADVENPDLVAYKNAPGTAGSLDQIVWFLETVNDKGVFPFRYPT